MPCSQIPAGTANGWCWRLQTTAAASVGHLHRMCLNLADVPNENPNPILRTRAMSYWLRALCARLEDSHERGDS